MNTVARDAFGVLSSKNTVSKYWGVSKVKGKEQFTVRFMEKVNKEIITFKPNFPITELACAVIAARFFDEPSLYALAEEPIEVVVENSIYKVNTCTNVISFVGLVDPLLNYVQEVPNNTTEVFEKLLDGGAPFSELSVLVAETKFADEVVEPVKQKKEKVVDHFRSLVDSIISGALSRAKAKLAAESAALYA